MKHIIFSDIHGNLEALEAFLKVTDGMQYERMYNLGDIVGYGADPNRCVEIVQSRNIPSVTGNHEDVVLGRAPADRFNPDAKKAINWCINELQPKNKEYLKSLGDFFWIDSSAGKTLLVHGSPLHKDHYVLTKNNAGLAFESMARQNIMVAFVGHTHIPCYWAKKSDEKIFQYEPDDEEPEIFLDKSLMVIINVGSVGQPRDGNSRGCFVIWDDVAHIIEFIRFEYPVAAAQEKIVKAGLPHYLAERLAGNN